MWIDMMIIGISLLSFLILLALLYLLVFVRPRANKPADPKLLCDYAHRGLHGGKIPENSLAAFERARLAGYGIELDVQLSKDGTVMVFHDYTLSRMTGKDKRLSELDAAELKTLCLAGSDQHIPTFSEVLSLVDGRVPLLVELKGESLDSSLCEKVAALLNDYKGVYCIESFNPLLIRKIKKYLPNAYVGQLYTNVCREKQRKSPVHILLTCMAFNFLARPDFIAYDKQDRNSFPVKLSTRFYHAEKFVWTVKSDSELETAHSLHEHPIFENTERNLTS